MVGGVSMPMALEKSLCGRKPRLSKYFFMVSIVETWTASLLNLSMKSRWDSSFPCMRASRDTSDLGWNLEVVKCREKVFHSCFQEVMYPSGGLLYQVIDPFLRVV